MKPQEEGRPEIKGDRFIFASADRRQDKNKKGPENKFVPFFPIASVCLFLLFSGQMLQGASPTSSSTMPTVKAVAARITPEKLKADLDFLFKTIEEVHPNMYAYVSKEEFAKHRDKLYAQINRPMRASEFYKLAAPVVAQLKNAHTHILPLASFVDYMKAGGKVFGLSVRREGHAIMLANHCSEGLPKGGQLLAINGEEAVKVADRFASWIPRECETTNPALIQIDLIFQCWLWVEYGSREHLTLTIQDANRVTRDYILKPVDPGELQQSLERRTKGPFYTFRRLSPQNIGLIDFRNFKDLRAFETFLSETFKEIREQGITALIIDLRSNPGGKGDLGDALLRYLTDEPFRQFEELSMKISPLIYEGLKRKPKLAERFFPGQELQVGKMVKAHMPMVQPTTNPYRFDGQVFVLIGPNSTSASTSLVWTIKRRKIGTLIGEETGDPTIFYASDIELPLPNSPLTLKVATARFVMVGAKKEGQLVAPDHEVKPRPEDIASGIDTVLEFALKIIRGNVRSGSISPRR